jgi:hypothetical protein
MGGIVVSGGGNQNFLQWRFFDTITKAIVTSGIPEQAQFI